MTCLNLRSWGGVPARLLKWRKPVDRIARMGIDERVDGLMG